MKYGHLFAFLLHVSIVTIFYASRETTAEHEFNEDTKDLLKRGPVQSTVDQPRALLTQSMGIPIGDIENSITAGPRGPMLLQDAVFLDTLGHFDRERIPERVVHAKGAGAFGYFQVTHDITKYSKAVPFSKIGKRTSVAVRFSTVIGSAGSSDTIRDLTGFAVKFYTEEGNWDVVGLSSPVFALRDSLLFPDFIHSQKKNPVNNFEDHNSMWDFFTLLPETVHHVMKLFSYIGLPNGFRHITGHAINTFKLVNAKGNPVYCKFHFLSNQGVESLNLTVAAQLAGTSPDYNGEDLYNAITANNYPSWTLNIQVMTYSQAEGFRYDPFDPTKLWPENEIPFIPVGKLVLNRNPINYFAEIEQMALDPGNLIPGIEPSPDKVLQGRMFSYGDTQRYRLGANFEQIPVNCPFNTKVRNYQRDGFMTVTENQGGAPNYYPNSFGGPQPNPKYLQSTFGVSGDAKRYNSIDDDNFSQPTLLWTEGLNATERKNLVNNLAASIVNAAPFIRTRAIGLFTNVHPDFGQAVSVGIKQLLRQQGGTNV